MNSDQLSIIFELSFIPCHMGVASNLIGVAFAAYVGHICYNFYSLSEIPLLEKPQQDAQYGVESFVPEVTMEWYGLMLN